MSNAQQPQPKPQAPVSDSFKAAQEAAKQAENFKKSKPNSKKK